MIVVDTVDGTESTLDVSGLFIAIGADPRTHLVHGQLDLNADGTIAVDGRSSRTNLAGVFAAGDVIDPTYRLAVTAAGEISVHGRQPVRGPKGPKRRRRSERDDPDAHEHFRQRKSNHPLPLPQARTSPGKRSFCCRSGGCDSRHKSHKHKATS